MEQTGKFSNGRAALGLLALVILAAAQLGAQLLASLPLMVGAPVWLGNVLAGVLYAALGVAGLLLLCGKGLRVTPEECRLAPVQMCIRDRFTTEKMHTAAMSTARNTISRP